MVGHSRRWLFDVAASWDVNHDRRLPPHMKGPPSIGSHASSRARRGGSTPVTPSFHGLRRPGWFDMQRSIILSALLNAKPVPGRLLPGYVVHRVGAFNTLCASRLLLERSRSSLCRS